MNTLTHINMVHKLINLICALVLVAGLVISAVAPGWAVWLICLPVIYIAALALIKNNTEWIETY